MPLLLESNQNILLNNKYNINIYINNVMLYKIKYKKKWKISSIMK